MPLTLGGAGARAVVIGIDRYDLVGISNLTGACADALAMCRWLVAIGLTTQDIRLHLSPMLAPSADQLTVDRQTLTYTDATWKSVWRSFNTLKSDIGLRLFVGLTGHGVVVPPKEPVFLLQDYGVDDDWSSNLGLESFINYFLSCDFKEQFLFCDTCENYAAAPQLRSRVEPRPPPDGAVTPRPDTGLSAVFAASPGQRAFEHEGRGLMMRRLLDALDPKGLETLVDDDPAQGAILYDWSSGERALRTSRLVEDVIAPAVSDAAQCSKNAAQTPRHVPYGARKVGPILRWTTEAPLTDVTVAAAPKEAAEGIKSVRLLTLAPAWEHHVLEPGATLPLVLKLPAGAEVVARAQSLQADRPVRPAQMQEYVGATPLRLEFSLADATRGAGSDLMHFNLRTYSDGGLSYNASGVYGLPEALNLGRQAQAAGLRIIHHEFGPDVALGGQMDGISFGDYDTCWGATAWLPDAFEAGRGLAVAWADLLRKYTGDTIAISPPGISFKASAPNLHIVGLRAGSRAVGHLATKVPLLIRPASGGLVDTVTVHLDYHGSGTWRTLRSGVYDASLNLPWGLWRKRIVICEGEVTILELPHRVGRTPLRNRLLREDGTVGLEAGAMVAALDDAAPVGRLISKGGLLLANCPGVSLAISENMDRVEPWSDIDDPAWDAVFTAGRLDWWDESQLRTLLEQPADAQATVESDLLRLAAAYALVAKHGLAGIRQVTFSSSIKHSLDARLLGGRAPSVARELHALRRPLLKWGYDLLATLGFGPMIAHEAVRQLDSSVWTALRGLADPEG